MKEALINCLGFRDYNGDYDCGYRPSVECEQCIINGGNLDPRTGKKYKGKNLKVYKLNAKRYREEATKCKNSKLSLQELLKEIV